MSQADTRPPVEPACASEVERCDGRDNTCEGTIDEGCPCEFGNSVQGVCKQARISQDSGMCMPPGAYALEEKASMGGCDGLDNDCDGQVDEGCELCDYANIKQGVCRYGQAYLSEENRAFNATMTQKRIVPLCLPPAAYHVEEADCGLGGTGDGVDNDCDGQVDEGCESPGVFQPLGQEMCTNGKDDDGDGDVDRFDADCPLPMPPAPRLGVADRATCVLQNDASVACFGSLFGGIKDVPAGAGWSAVAAGSFFGCVLDAQGAPTCWGRTSTFEVPMPSGLRLRSIAAGHSHVCGVSLQGEAVCWGVCAQGECDGPTALGPVVEVAAGRTHSCGRDEAGRVECWGGLKRYQQPPKEMRFDQVVAGFEFSCGIMSRTKHVLCWGDNALLPPPVGEFPENDPERHRFRPYTSISAMWNHVCGIDLSGETRCWGYNVHGQTSPPASLRSVEVVAGGYHSCSLNTSGELVCWGRNEFGQFGNIEREFKMVSKHVDHMCGWDKENTLVCFSSTVKPVREYPLKEIRIKQDAVTSLGVGERLGCVVAGGELVCWTQNEETKVVAAGLRNHRVRCVKAGCIALGARANDQAYTYGTSLLFGKLTEFLGTQDVPLVDVDLQGDRGCVVVGERAVEITPVRTSILGSGARRCAVSADYTLVEKAEQVTMTDERTKKTQDFGALPLPLRSASCGIHGCYVVDREGGLHARGEKWLVFNEDGKIRDRVEVFYHSGDLYNPMCVLKNDGKFICW